MKGDYYRYLSEVASGDAKKGKEYSTFLATAKLIAAQMVSSEHPPPTPMWKVEAFLASFPAARGIFAKRRKLDDIEKANPSDVQMADHLLFKSK